MPRAGPRRPGMYCALPVPPSRAGPQRPGTSGQRMLVRPATAAALSCSTSPSGKHDRLSLEDVTIIRRNHGWGYSPLPFWVWARLRRTSCHSERREESGVGGGPVGAQHAAPPQPPPPAWASPARTLRRGTACRAPPRCLRVPRGLGDQRQGHKHRRHSEPNGHDGEPAPTTPKGSSLLR
jgi:hypothetical protein